MKGVSTREAYENLANAIVMLAAMDYKAALESQARGVNSKCAIEKLEKFFFSPWYEFLTDVDPTYIIRRIREEVKDRRKEECI